ncbi:MAG: hypothetical protein KA998_04825 [Rickettsiaceae bacterium]|nr:hypothetical protein [Rickettsiaceae bacterium]
MKDNNKLKDDLLDLGATDEKNQTNNDIYRIEINHLNDQLKKQNEQILKQLETIASITGEKFEQETATVSITNISAKTSENTPLTEEQVTAENPTKKKTIGESIYEFIRSITKSQTQEILENTQKENDALKEKKNKLTKKVLEQTVINKSLNNQIAELRKLSEEKKSMIEKNETTIAKKTTEKEEELINAKEVEEAELIKAKKEATNQNPDDKSHQAIEKTPEISQTTTTDHTDTQKTQQQTKEEKRALQRFAEQTLNITKKVSSFLTGTYNNKRTLNHKSDSSKENTNTHS